MMDAIIQKALQTFEQNMLFFQATQPELFAKVDALNVAIEKGYHQEKYSLEYLDGYFDVKENETGKFFYGENSLEYAQKAAKSVDFKKEDNLFETFYDVKIDDSITKAIEKKDISVESYATSAELIAYWQKHANKHTTTMIKIYKFIFFGVGLGTHLSTIHDKLHSNCYLFIEDDLELFRLSMFVTDYTYLAKDGAELYFSVFEEGHEFRNTLRKFYNAHFVYNHFLKFFAMLHVKEQKIKEVQEFIASQTHLTFNYAALLISILRPLEYLVNGYKLLDISSSYCGSILSKSPVIILGAGPSLEKNIEWLQQNQNKFLIVAVSALMSKLEKYNIKPDIITHVHGYSDAMPHLEKVKDIHFFDETILLFGGMSYPDFTIKFKKENVFIIEGSSRYKRGHGGITSSNIGAISYGLMLKLCVEELYLLGLDFAPDQTTGATHTDTHAHTREVELQKEFDLEEAVSYKDELIHVEGNKQKEVATTLILNDMRLEAQAVAKSFRYPHSKVYNFSDNGAKVDHTEPLDTQSQKVKNLPDIDKKTLFKELYTLFDSHASATLTKEEREDLEKKIAYCNRVNTKLFEHLNKNITHIDLYHYNLLGTLQEILSTDSESVESNELDKVLTLYLHFASGFIFDLINTKEVDDKEKLIKHLDRAVIPQIMRVVEYFRDALKRTLNDIKQPEQNSGLS